MVWTFSQKGGKRSFIKEKVFICLNDVKKCRTKRKQAYEERQRHKEISAYLAKLPFREVDKKELSLLEADLSLLL